MVAIKSDSELQRERHEHAATARTLVHEMERFESGTPDWARLASLTFAFHAWAPVSERPFWWDDASLLVVSERVTRALPRDPSAWAMRGQVLAARTFVGVGRGAPWLAGARSTEQLREAAAAFGKAAELPPVLGSPHHDVADLDAWRDECVRIADSRTAGGAATSTWEQMPLQPAAAVPGHAGELHELAHEDDLVALSGLVHAMVADLPAPGRDDRVVPAAFDEPGLALPADALAADADEQRALELAGRALAAARTARGGLPGPKSESLLERAFGQSLWEEGHGLSS